MLKQSIDNNSKFINDSLNNYGDSLNAKYFFIYAVKYNNQATVSGQFNTRPSMLSPHLLKQKHYKAQSIQNYSTDWILILLLLCTAIFTWIYYSSSKRIKQIFNATFTNRSLNQLSRDGDLFKERNSIPLLINYLITISLFIFFSIHYFVNLKAANLYNILTFLKISGITALLVMLRWLITSFIGFVFKNNNASSFFLLNSLIFNIVIGLLLIPLNILLFYVDIEYSNQFLFIGFLIILIANAIRYFRYIIIGISYSKFSQFYLFLYLCTLEILPVIILVKIFIGLIDKYLH